MSIQDLEQRFPIVNKDGTPTDYFMRLLRDRGSSQAETDATVETTTATLTALETTVANLGLDDLTDVDTTTTPPTDGQALVWVDADSEWAPGDSVATARGALVKKSANQTAADFTAATELTWDAEVYDDMGIHSTSVNTNRLTVPAGVTRIRLIGQLAISALNADMQIFAYMSKNGATTWDGRPSQRTESGALGGQINLSSPVLQVVAGDYFALGLSVEADTSITIEAAASWFAMEIVA